MRVNKKKIISIFTIILLVVAIFMFSNETYAEINENYGGSYSVDSEGLNDAMEDSTALNLISKLIYAVGRLLEWILGTIFQAISGTADFPWADKIVFNAVPILDVNFINPNENSFIGNSAIGDALGNTYSTIFGISLSFFSIFVMISAIKLAFSTIADQKAKYKQALVDWALGLVMLFTIHYFMSFMFYLNERLVETASSMVGPYMDAASEFARVQQTENTNKVLENARIAGLEQHKIDYLEANFAVVETWVHLESGDDSKGIHEGIMKSYNFWSGTDSATNVEGGKKDLYNRLYETVWYIVEQCPNTKDLEELRQKIFYIDTPANVDSVIVSLPKISLPGVILQVIRTAAVNNTGDETLAIMRKTLQQYNFDPADGGSEGRILVTSGLFGGEDELKSFKIQSNDIEKDPSDHSKRSGATDLAKYSNKNYRITIEDTKEIRQNNITVGGECYYPKTKRIDMMDYLTDLIRLKSAVPNNSVDSNSNSEYTNISLISDLGTYFKLTSQETELRTTNVTGTKTTGNIRLSNAIMYAVLVGQSLILFISYMKRLFYVIILGMMSPAVVAYDFFKRFGK